MSLKDALAAEILRSSKTEGAAVFPVVETSETISALKPEASASLTDDMTGLLKNPKTFYKVGQKKKASLALSFYIMTIS